MKYLIVINASGTCCGNRGPRVFYALATVEDDSVSVSPVIECYLMIPTRYGKWDTVYRGSGISEEILTTIIELLAKDRKLLKSTFELGVP